MKQERNIIETEKKCAQSLLKQDKIQLIKACWQACTY